MTAMRAETDHILTELSHELPPHIMRRLDRALAAERAAGEKSRKRLLHMLRAVETLIEVEQRHVTHDYEHEPADVGEQYEDCSACRWHQIREGIRAALREEAPDAA